MLSLYFLQVASHCHFLSVLDLCVFFLFVAQAVCAFFCADKTHICGAVALSQEGFRFTAFFMILL